MKDIFRRLEFSVQKMMDIICFNDKENLSQLHDPEISIEDLFDWIYLNFKFYDYSTLQTVVNDSQCGEAIILMNNYVREIEDTLIHELDLKSGSQMQEYKIHGDANMLKVVCEIRKLSAKEYNCIVKTLNSWLNLPPGCFILKEIITRDTVILKYEISSKVKDYMMKINITPYELKFLASLMITSLIINDKLELKVSSDWNTKVTTHTSSNFSEH